MSLRSPLGKVLGRGAAKSGVAHWWAQRVSAVALVPLTLWFVIELVQLPAGDQQQVREWVVAALEGLGPPPEASVAELAPLVGSEDPLAAYWAITLLGRVGQAAKAALPVLKARLASPDEAVGRRAAWAIEKIGPA